jgi:hypothetical protein
MQLNEIWSPDFSPIGSTLGVPDDGITLGANGLGVSSDSPGPTIPFENWGVEFGCWDFLLNCLNNFNKPTQAPLVGIEKVPRERRVITPRKWANYMKLY